VGIDLRPDDDGTLIRVRLQPRASENEIGGEAMGALRVRVSAPPVAGRANRALCKLLADALGVPSRAVTVASGQRARQKTVRVAGLAPEVVAARLGVSRP
jgi:uncharacterized protein (TIGR00251 family)